MKKNWIKYLLILVLGIGIGIILKPGKTETTVKTIPEQITKVLENKQKTEALEKTNDSLRYEIKKKEAKRIVIKEEIKTLPITEAVELLKTKLSEYYCDTTSSYPKLIQTPDLDTIITISQGNLDIINTVMSDYNEVLDIKEDYEDIIDQDLDIISLKDSTIMEMDSLMTETKTNLENALQSESKKTKLWKGISICTTIVAILLGGKIIFTK